MDEDTVNLIIALQMEDLDLLISGQKGKAIEGSALADNQIAVELQKAELQKQETMLADLRIARSISRAVQDDGATVAILTAEERRCAQDRETACRLSGQPHHHALNLPDCRVEDDILARFGSLNIRQADNKDEDDDLSCYGESVVSFNEQESGENSSWAAGRKTGNSKGESKAKSKCVACSDTQDTLQAPCQHHYCKKCVIRLVGDSTVDESLFPPRCYGQEMPMSLFRPYITAELTAKFERKAIELGTPYRTYCYSCGIFINSDGIQGHQAHCTTCNRNTCMLCKCKFHGGDCPKDLALEAVLELARGTGWQRCTNCQAMIERREGCNHITCRCGYQFCYECGQKWKTCTCIVYDEDMLLQRARIIAHRDAEPGAAPRAERIQQIRNNLRDRRDCDHRGRWAKLEGPHRCEECDNYLHQYILQCRHCMLQACVRCKGNRL